MNTANAADFKVPLCVTGYGLRKTSIRLPPLYGSSSAHNVFSVFGLDNDRHQSIFRKCTILNEILRFPETEFLCNVKEILRIWCALASG